MSTEVIVRKPTESETQQITEPLSLDTDVSTLTREVPAYFPTQFTATERILMETDVQERYKSVSLWKKFLAGKQIKESIRAEVEGEREQSAFAAISMAEQGATERNCIETARREILKKDSNYSSSSKQQNNTYDSLFASKVLGIFKKNKDMENSHSYPFASQALPKWEEIKTWEGAKKWAKFGAKVYGERGMMVTIAVSAFATVASGGILTGPAEFAVASHRAYKSLLDVHQSGEHAQYAVEMARLRLVASGSAGEDKSGLERVREELDTLRGKYHDNPAGTIGGKAQRVLAFGSAIASFADEEAAIARVGAKASSRMKHGDDFLAQREELLDTKNPFIKERRMQVCEQIAQLVEKEYIADESTLPALAELKQQLEATFSSDIDTQTLRAQIAKEVADTIIMQEQTDIRWVNNFVLRRKAVRALFAAGGAVTAAATYLHFTAKTVEALVAVTEHTHGAVSHGHDAVHAASHMADIADSAPKTKSLSSILSEYKAHIGSVSFEQNPVLQNSFHMQVEHGKLVMQGVAGQGNGVAFEYPNGAKFIVVLDAKTHMGIIDPDHLTNTITVIKGTKEVTMTQQEVLQMIVSSRNPQSTNLNSIIQTLKQAPDGVGLDTVWQKSGVSLLGSKASLVTYTHGKLLDVHYIASSGAPAGHPVENVILPIQDGSNASIGTGISKTTAAITSNTTHISTSEINNTVSYPSMQKSADDVRRDASLLIAGGGFTIGSVLTGIALWGERQYQARLQKHDLEESTATNPGTSNEPIEGSEPENPDPTVELNEEDGVTSIPPWKKATETLREFSERFGSHIAEAITLFEGIDGPPEVHEIWTDATKFSAHTAKTVTTVAEIVRTYTTSTLNKVSVSREGSGKIAKERLTKEFTRLRRLLKQEGVTIKSIEDSREVIAIDNVRLLEYTTEPSQITEILTSLDIPPEESTICLIDRSGSETKLYFDPDMSAIAKEMVWGMETKTEKHVPIINVLVGRHAIGKALEHDLNMRIEDVQSIKIGTPIKSDRKPVSVEDLSEFKKLLGGGINEFSDEKGNYITSIDCHPLVQVIGGEILSVEDILERLNISVENTNISFIRINGSEIRMLYDEEESRIKKGSVWKHQNEKGEDVNPRYISLAVFMKGGFQFSENDPRGEANNFVDHDIKSIQIIKKN